MADEKKASVDFMDNIGCESIDLFNEIKKAAALVKDDSYLQYNLLNLIRKSKDEINKIYDLIKLATI